MNARITYLDNSGFLVDTGNHILIFDAYNERPVGGAVDPAEFADKKVVVFVSHAHGDHYNPAIFKWEAQIGGIRYVLSHDIRPHAGALMVEPHGEYALDDIKIKTLRSTDEGVAFLVFVDGLCIYHAGDLNWWHWEGEDTQWNADVARDYKQEIDNLKDEKIDIAFVPVDPRLDGALLLGVEYFMNTAGATLVIPMHYGGAGETAARALENADRPVGCHFVPPMNRGETLVWERA